MSPALAFKHALIRMGFDIKRLVRPKVAADAGAAPTVDPVWPLPVRPGMSPDTISEIFHRYPDWHYSYAFEGGLHFPPRPAKPAEDPHRQRPHQRFRHFMPEVIAHFGGSLKGIRVLDIACNTGYWSVQCALQGAEVTAFDARPELVAQTTALADIVGAKIAVRQLDFFEMTPDAFDGPFDLVLNLGLLYHLPNALETLQRSLAMTRQLLVVDTVVSPWSDRLIRLQWEQAREIRDTAHTGIIALPTRSAVELMLRHLGVEQYQELPLRRLPMPVDYRRGDRTTWIVNRGAEHQA